MHAAVPDPRTLRDHGRLKAGPTAYQPALGVRVLNQVIEVRPNTTSIDK